MHPDIPIETAQIETLAVALGIGLLMGLEREQRPSARAGLRTFALVALFGALNGLLGDRLDSLWPFALGTGLVAAMIIAAYLRQPDPLDPGTTTVVALLLCHTLGFMVWQGYVQLSIMIAVATTVLLYFKATLRGWAARLTPKDWISILQFGVLSLVILPVLPDENFGPFGALNPHQIWLMVVLIAGVSLAGYAALKLVGNRYGAALVGFLGGLVSSTATTLVFARDARERDEFAPAAALVIVLANLVMVIRVGAIVAVLAPTLLPMLLRVVVPGLVLGAVAVLLNWRDLRRHESVPVPETKNPTELRAALAFGTLYAGVLFGSAWLSESVGNGGLYAIALASGLTDVDAITLSSLRLFSLERLSAAPTVIAAGLAMIANLGFKTGMAISIGGRPLARPVLTGMTVTGLGLGAGLAWIALVP
ncbi:MgtC/SapB family protein [Nitrogeniibacter mangrovi]|uniref:MgtC/SapB family protein n=1 Tax=Nitrogeniibacter mangrovi TaxID=2016596 RepID=A0A6C1B6A6_9RHOO|nr:MgtC/SapB family protein [Nitrogeniibacter mangrovi]QID17820.1 MgtC/SapB family protein [Nitrogeniibacter mangrovi]